jgi:uncharacterized protein YcbK (DUF882 family)
VAAVLALGLALFGTGHANAQTRSLKVFNMHTREKATIVFKRNGRFDQSGLRQLNQFMRDWRRNEPTKMDPRLFDLLWEAYKQSGSNDYIHVVCGYRSPQTNSMLRSRSKGVAKKSQHMLGRAMDFYIPDVRLKKLREIGLKMQGGGVGYYPRSGSPFVHFDVGNVRHWPKMSRRELIALFPSGKTLHVPSDGKPLPGFDQALASYKSRKKSGDVAIASLGSSKSSSRSGGNLLTALFGGGADEEEDTASEAVAEAAAPARQPKAEQPKPEKPKAEVQIAKADKKADNKIRIVPPEFADPVDIPAAEPETIVAALPARNAPIPGFAPRPEVDVGTTSTASLYGDPNQQAAEPAEVALNIPVPTPRPDNTPPPELAGDAVLVASADPAMTIAKIAEATAGVPLPATRPGEESDDQIAAIAALTTERMEAEPDADEAADGYTVASLPETAPAAIDTAFPTSPDEIIPEAKATDPTMLSYAATPRSALVSRAPGTDPTTAAIPAVKTTAKAARPSSKDLKRTAKQPVVVAAQPQAARWALDSAYVMQNAKGTTAPKFGYNLVHNAPSEVYTAGFQQGTLVADTDARRFTGKAVTFLTVARFSTN